MKKYIMVPMTILILLIAGICLMTIVEYMYDETDTCLDRGGCWDYIRNRCEMNDQGYCERDEQDCLNRNGIWQKNEQYCILKGK